MLGTGDDQQSDDKEHESKTEIDREREGVQNAMGGK